MQFIFLFSLIFSLALCACNQSSNNKALQTRIDSLEKHLANTYKPGLGEFMSDIQVHHNKLWFARQNQNWDLADFEVGEIKESLTDIQNYCTDRPEVNSIGIIYPAIESISNAIQRKDPNQFKNSYILLTNTCNNCHGITQHQFNVIKIPDSPAFTNQGYKVR